MRTLSSSRASAKVEQARIIALASWCEQLRDLLTAEYGIVGTIGATARTCPEPIRPEVERLSTRLSRQDPRNAIRQFAAELDDPSGDLVASVLLLAMSRSSRTSELLSELAGTIRERAAMRLRVEADRSGQRSEARFIIAFSAIAITGVLIFGRGSEFLDAYDDPSGQLVLAFVIACFAVGGWWMSRLTRFERPDRFLSISEDQ
jgi:Flp pilus assembly protein TadB